MLIGTTVMTGMEWHTSAAVCVLSMSGKATRQPIDTKEINHVGTCIECPVRVCFNSCSKCGPSHRRTTRLNNAKTYTPRSDTLMGGSRITKPQQAINSSPRLGRKKRLWKHYGKVARKDGTFKLYFMCTVGGCPARVNVQSERNHQVILSDVIAGTAMWVSRCMCP